MGRAASIIQTDIMESQLRLYSSSIERLDANAMVSSSDVAKLLVRIITMEPVAARAYASSVLYNLLNLPQPRSDAQKCEKQFSSSGMSTEDNEDFFNVKVDKASTFELAADSIVKAKPYRQPVRFQKCQLRGE